LSERQLIVLEDAQAVHVRAAEEIAHIAGEAVCNHGQFTLCMAGGTTPAAVYGLLATRFRLSVDWKEVQFFWGDERCVAPDHESSNYGMANRAMLSKLGINPARIHRIQGELEPHKAAEAYQDELRKSFALSDGEIPRFDLILLGLGTNAHIASLFPGDQAIRETKCLAVAVEVDDPTQRHRVSLTAPVLNNAARVMFLVHGVDKASAVYQVIEGPRDVDRYPGQIIAPTDGDLTWIMDKQAASRLSGR
jgi:6-phosphogluconolactonase